VNAGPSVGVYRGECLSGPEGLRSLRAEWEALARRSTDYGVSCSYPIYDALLRCRHPEPGRVHFFCVRGPSGRLVAICPLELTRTRIRRVRFKCWSVPPDPDRPASSFLLARDADPAAAGRALAGLLETTAPAASLLCVERVVEEGPTMAVLRSVTPRHHCAAGPSLAVLGAERSADEWLAHISSKFRRNIRWGLRRMERLGNLEYRVAGQAAQLGAALEEFLALEAAGWKGGAPHGRALARAGNVERHARQLVASFSEQDGCEIHGLWLDGRCVAALLCFRAGGELFAFKIARDEQFSTYSLGQLLVFRVMSALSQRETVRAVNFGWEAGWLEPWGGETIGLATFYGALGGVPGSLALWLLGWPVLSRSRAATKAG
jgi:CelD/BcsL family acetyltransferase involved in cellulose biosynthesis